MKLMSSLITVCLALPCSCFAANEALIGTAQRFLERQIKDYLQQSRLNGRWQITFTPIDSRLSAKSCEKPLSTSLESRAPIGRLTVKVRCEMPAWTLLLPAQVSVWQPVLAARYPLKRGQQVHEADFTWVERDIGALPQGWLSDSRLLQGQQLTRRLSTGQLLLSSQLKAAQLIAPGEPVQILSQSDGIRVQMKGEALSAGSLGQLIRVRNLSSGRVLRARVVAQGQVEAQG